MWQKTDDRAGRPNRYHVHLCLQHTVAGLVVVTIR
jgi:hypothetical protein